MNPVALPIERRPCQLDERRLASRRRGSRLCLQHALVITRHDLHKYRLQRVEILKHTRPELAARVLHVAGNETADQLTVSRLAEWLEIDHLRVASALDRAGRVEHVRDAAAHSRRKVASGF